jgi:lipid-binding SYLF domain-containing protein
MLDMSLTKILTCTLLSCVLASPSLAATREEERVADAAFVVEEFYGIPEQRIPPNLLANAGAIAVIPGVKKVGLGLGGRFGRGIVVVRRDDGSWSSPAFITLTGGSIGWQVGVQSTDVILVFKSKRGVDNITSGKLTLGADASVAAGPVGRQAGAATDIYGDAEVYSYSRNRGLFAGVAFDGSGITMDTDANAAFYGDPTLTPDAIFERSPNSAPPVAQQFVTMVDAATSGESRPVPANREQSPAQSPETATPPGEVKTYGIPDPDDPDQ